MQDINVTCWGVWQKSRENAFLIAIFVTPDDANEFAEQQEGRSRSCSYPVQKLQLPFGMFQKELSQ